MNERLGAAIVANDEAEASIVVPLRYFSLIAHGSRRSYGCGQGFAFAKVAPILDAANDIVNTCSGFSRRSVECVFGDPTDSYRSAINAGSECAISCATAGRFVEQREAGELESGRDAAADQRIGAERACRLPAMGWNDDQRVGVARAIEATEAVTGQCCRFGIEDEDFQRIALGVMPALVGIDAVPAAAFTGGEQVVDRTQRRALAAGRGHACGGFVDAPVVTAFGVRQQRERIDQFAGARMHGVVCGRQCGMAISAA